MKIDVFSSDSSGNTTLVRNGFTNIIIDLGLNKKSIVENLSKFNLKIEDIDGIFITHEHIDHVNGFPAIMNVYQGHIYMTKGTLLGIKDKFKNKPNFIDKLDKYITSGHIVTLTREDEALVYNKIILDDFEITPVKTFHDAKESCGYILKSEGKTLVFITDTGYVHEGLLPTIYNAEAYILESNHDPEILMHSERPYILKRRILSDTGHLSNEDSMVTLAKSIGDRTKLVMHAHISQECNLSDIIVKTRERVFKDFNKDTNGVEFVILHPYPEREHEI
jgi:phosphoribosyl 1,2-cyclic phosphodiesterase